MITSLSIIMNFIIQYFKIIFIHHKILIIQ